MPRYVTRIFLLWVLLIGCAQAADVAVPKDLEDWRGWVLQGQEYRRCPFIGASPEAQTSYRCAWPQPLAISVDMRGGTFTQRWQVLTESWIRLPGNPEHWPQDVRVDGERGAVVSREGFPHVRLAAGEYTLAGKLTWATRPESLPIDPRTAVVDLNIEGRRVPQPERPGGGVWLGKRRTAEQPARMEVQVYRLVEDSVPAQLLTRIRLQVSGDGREELLARVLPDEFTAVTLTSELPARLESDGRLRVQVRAGSWDIDLAARGVNVASRLARPRASEGLWPREEVWSFSGDDRLRVAAAQGVDGIDPVQANVPEEWHGFPAFRMAQNSILEISERSRGLQNADDNRLVLQRQLWLDFDHGGLTAVDQLSGTMRKDWRLQMAAPYALQSARVGNESLLVTRNPTGNGTGLEIRSPQLQLQAVARTASSKGAMPATGWNARFDRVSGQLNLPPGHRLIAALGADRAPGAWIERWRLWGLFGVLVVAVFAGWLAGWIVGAVAFVALLLTYQEGQSYIWLWSNLLAALALARAAPEGKLRTFARRYRALSFAVLGVALLPFLWGQARLALHPQLDSRVGVGEPLQAVLVTANRAPSADVSAVVPAPAPPPPPEVAEGVEGKALASTRDEGTEEIQVTAMRRREGSAPDNPYASSYGLNAESVVQRYAPGTLVQTGPGIPSWRYIAYAYNWSGPVEPQQSVRFLYIGPIALGIWRFVGAFLLAALFFALLVSGDRGRWDWPDARNAMGRFVGGAGAQAGITTAALSAAGLALPLLGPLVLTLVLMAAPSLALAESPSADLLNDLRTRLTRAPDCTPTCVEVTDSQVTVRGDRLEVLLDVSALVAVAVPVPSAGDRWQLDTVTIDGRSSMAIGREQDGTLAVPMTAGAHRILLGGMLPAAQSLQLEFPRVPRAIAVSSEGWDVNGLNEGRLLSGSLELVRRRTSAGTAGLETGSEFPAFVRVNRTFDLALDWSLSTTVERVAPEKAAITVEIPLLNGESALSESLRTRDLPGGQRVALVGLERGQQMASWSSGLARSETLQLSVPASAARSEVWRFVVSPQWNIAFEGLPAVLPESVNPSSWVYEFHPRSGETLKARITRPERAEGATLAIDSVQQAVQFGKRSANTTLAFQYRSTQGGRHALALPEAARVKAVQLDGQPVQLRPENGVLSIGLLPGAHSVRVEWEVPQGARLRTHPPAVDLHQATSNVQTSISLPADRWPLFVTGAGVGPAVMYWSELVVFLLTAVLLGRWPQSPLRIHEWLLLGLGLSTLSWPVFAMVGFWLFALRWREGWDGGVSRWRFNGVQVALAALTVIAVGALVFAGIRQSLLASPDMGITGPGSYRTDFVWFLDRSGGQLPQPSVISVPMWVYRALMFAWALWLVLALLRWLRWAWNAWKVNGFWRSNRPVAA